MDPADLALGEPLPGFAPANMTDQPAITLPPDASLFGDGIVTMDREGEIVGEARDILTSSEFDRIRAAASEGRAVTEQIGGRTIQYEPDLPASGMTMFGDNGFFIGPEAFTSEEELGRTVLHELYRLETTQSSGGVSADLASRETREAASFAHRRIGDIIK